MVRRYIEVDKLIKKSFQFNMEFLQFMKCYWDMHAPGATGAPVLKDSSNEPPPQQAPAPRKAAPASAPAPAAAGAARRVATGARGPPPAAAAAEPAPPSAAVTELQLEVTELKCNVDNLERERDFYYSKLREIEVLCQQNEGKEPPFLNEVMTILYKTDADDEFVAPAEVPAEA